jgi:FtsH-binding integral membrane protein
MSLTDPDARNQRVGSALRPLAWVLAILGLASSPLLVAWVDTLSNPDSVFAFVFLGYVVLSVGFGLMLYYTAAHRNALGITAFVFAYLGGLILILGAEKDKQTGLPEGLIPALVAYGIAVVLIVIYIFHSVAAHQTLTNGVTTTATVTAAGINGMVNYVQHWKLTLKFTDQQGKERWFHIGRTGLGYQVGQTFTIKYNGKNPGSKRGIVVMDG